MADQKIQKQFDEINKKLDVILEEIELQRQHRLEMDDLKDDLQKVGKDIYQTAATELDEVSDHIQTGDILHLGKKLLRNTNNLNKAFDQLESVRDFIDDVSPLARESIIDLMKKLDEYDRKGYFQFIKELQGIADNVVTSFSAEDVKLLGDNIVTILSTVKNLTQPEMLQAINNALAVYKNINFEINGKVSFFSLIKDLNSPEAKKGMAVGIQFLKNLAANQKQNSIIKINHIQKN